MKRQKFPKVLEVEYLKNVIPNMVIYTNSMKTSRRPTVFRHFSILDVDYNSNFLGVDVKGRCNFIFGASYRHLKNLIGFIFSSGMLDAHFILLNDWVSRLLRQTSVVRS